MTPIVVVVPCQYLIINDSDRHNQSRGGFQWKEIDCPFILIKEEKLIPYIFLCEMTFLMFQIFCF